MHIVKKLESPLLDVFKVGQSLMKIKFGVTHYNLRKFILNSSDFNGWAGCALLWGSTPFNSQFIQVKALEDPNPK